MGIVGPTVSTAQAATARPAIAAIRTADLSLAALTSRTEHAVPSGSKHVTLYYDQGLAIGSDTVGAIAAIVAAIGTWVQIILKGREGKGGGGNGEDDEIIIIEGDDGEDNGDCLRAIGDNAEWYSCGSSGAALTGTEWIEVPTGASYALENQYFYNQGDRDYLQVNALSNGAPLWVEPDQGNEDTRTWYFPS